MRTFSVKAILTAVFCVLAALTSYSSDKDVQVFLTRLKTARVQLGFNFASADPSMPVSGSGVLTAQANSFLITGDGLRVFCNGKSIITIDDSSKEVVAEDCNLDLGRFIKRLSVQSQGGRITSASYKMENGKSIVIDLPFTNWLEAGPLSDFEFDLTSLDSGYVITDLRSF